MSLIVGPRLDLALDDDGQPTGVLIRWCEEHQIRLEEVRIVGPGNTCYTPFTVACLDPEKVDDDWLKRTTALLPLGVRTAPTPVQFQLACPNGQMNCHQCFYWQRLGCKGKL
jgi:hypothetical protein